MNEKALIFIPDDIFVAIKAFDNDYLAEVLRLWNCDLGDWHDPCTMIFRFESNDILVWNEQSFLRGKVGAVVESNLETSTPDAIKASIETDTCLCWLHDRSYNKLIGSTNVCNYLLDSVTPIISHTQD